MVSLLVLGVLTGGPAWIVFALRMKLPLLSHTTEYECGTCGTKHAGHTEHGIGPWAVAIIGGWVLILQGIRQVYRWTHYGPPTWFTMDYIIWRPLSIMVPIVGAFVVAGAIFLTVRHGIRKDRAAKAQLRAEAFNQPHTIPRLDPNRTQHDPAHHAHH